MSDKDLQQLIEEIRLELEIVSANNIEHEVNKGKSAEDVINYFRAKEEEAAQQEIYLRGGDSNADN